MCNELFHNDNVIVKHDLIYYLFFLLCVGSFEVKYIICKCPIYLYKKKAKRKKLHLWEIYVLLQSETSFYIVIFYIQISLSKRKLCVFCYIYFCLWYEIPVCKEKNIWWKKTSKNVKRKENKFLST